MKKRFLLPLALAGASALCLASCGNGGSGSGSGASDSGKQKNIAIGLYTLTGCHFDALKAYLEPIGTADNIKFTYFETGYDSSSLLSAVQKQVKADAIISTMDGGEALANACKNSKQYLAGYLCDYENSYDTIKSNPYFLGTAVDGAYRGTAWGTHIAERVIADGKKNIALIKYPDYAYPHQAEMDTAFRAKIAEYNATCTAEQKIKVSEQTTEMPFFGFDMQSYLQVNTGIDAIYAMCGGVDSMFPNMTDAQKASIKLYTAGYNTTITSADFGTNGCIQEMVYCTVESINYPLAMILNKLDGKDYTDTPTEAQRVETSQVIVQTNDDLEYVHNHSIYHTAKAKDAMTTPAEFNQLLAKNGGTHAKLVNSVQSLALSDLRTKFGN